MLEKVYERANEKIYIKDELIEDTEKKIMQQLKDTPVKGMHFYKYGMVAASLCLAVIIGFGILPGGFLRSFYSKIQISNMAQGPDNSKDNSSHIKDEKLNENNMGQYGNSMGNIMNVGFAAKHDNYIFFSDYGLYKLNIDTNEIIKISDDSPFRINIWGDFIYYRNYEDGKIYRTDFDGNIRDKIIDCVVRGFIIKDGWIYYNEVNLNEKASDYVIIKRIKVDGSEEMTIVSEKVSDNTRSGGSEFFLYGDWVYYQSPLDEKKLYKIKVDGTEKTKVSDEAFPYYLHEGQFIVDEGWIYYVQHIGGETLPFKGKVYKMRTDGTEKQLVIDNNVGDINMNEDYIFYSNTDDNYKLYKIKKDGSDNRKISDLEACNVNILGSYIYCNKLQTIHSFYMMNLDGVELELFQRRSVLSYTNYFIDTVNDKNKLDFESLASRSGLIVIRNYVSGNGTRGKDIRKVYAYDQLPSDFQFSVNDEEAIVIDKLFPASMKNGVEGIKVIKIEDKRFEFKDTVNGNVAEPSTKELWELCREIQSLARDKNGSEPYIYMLGDNQFAFAEADTDSNTGSWVIFERVKGSFYIRAILDFR